MQKSRQSLRARRMSGVKGTGIGCRPVATPAVVCPQSTKTRLSTSAGVEPARNKPVSERVCFPRRYNRVPQYVTSETKCNSRSLPCAPHFRRSERQAVRVNSHTKRFVAMSVVRNIQGSTNCDGVEAGDSRGTGQFPADGRRVLPKQTGEHCLLARATVVVE